MEHWKNIENTNGMYQVSNEGRVKRLPTVKKMYNFMKGELVDVHYAERIFEQTLDKTGYLHVHMPRKTKIPTLVHKLVAEAFLEIPEELKQYEGTQKLQINHKDECKTNNFVFVNDDGSVDPEKSNLEWCTAKYNSNYGTRNERMGAKLKGRRPSDATIKASVEKSRKPVIKFSMNWEYIETYPSVAEAERQNEGIYHGNITRCCDGSGRLKSTGGFKWKYADS